MAKFRHGMQKVTPTKYGRHGIPVPPPRKKK